MKTNLKRIFAAFLTVLVVMGMVGPASAATVEELEALVAQLQAQLQALLGAQQQSQPALLLTKDLRYGMTDSEVSILQQGLARDPQVYPEGLVTGYFGTLTRAAVVRFQEKYASEVLTPLGLTSGTGFAGAATRAKFNALYGTPVVVSPTPSGSAVPTATPTPEEEPRDNKNNDEKKDTTEDDESGYNFPEGYTVSKESCNTENALSSLSVMDCVEVYKIQPANYTALEKKYLLNASLAVFSKPNNVVIPGQVTETRYDSQLKKWVFEDGNGELKVLPERIENSNIIVETSQEGSQRGWDYIIISKPNVSSLLILSIPKYHRIVCDYIENTTEKMECERFLASLGLNPGDEGWLPGSIYQTAYSSLRSNASTIW